MGMVVNATSLPFYPRDRPDIHCLGVGWVPGTVKHNSVLVDYNNTRLQRHKIFSLFYDDRAEFEVTFFLKHNVK